MMNIPLVCDDNREATYLNLDHFEEKTIFKYKILYDGWCSYAFEFCLKYKTYRKITKPNDNIVRKYIMPIILAFWIKLSTFCLFSKRRKNK